MLGRTLFATITLSSALASVTPSCLDNEASTPAVIDDNEFSRLVHDLSEDGGYFWSNNYISNETSYLHVVNALESLVDHEGVYLGVGPNQNFTYIAAVRPSLAFIVDIRRQNMLEHLLFKVLIQKSASREEYLSRLLGRPLEQPLEATATLSDIVNAIEDAAPDESFFRDELAAVVDELRRMPGLDLSEADLEDLTQIYREFYRQGFGIKYDSWRSFFFPSLKEFILETDLEGRNRNWLATAESYAFIREMEHTNRIVPVVGDFAGEQALRRLGRLLESRGATISVFYVSNVEFYLFRQRKWSSFVDNVRQLPTTERSVFVRAYANLHRPHPNMVDDHITITLVQNIHSFLRNAREGRYRNLWDVVTTEDF